MAQQLTNILLETGTNELELIEFTIKSLDQDGNEIINYFGINVAKVREIIKAPKITDIPKTNSNIEGMVNLRGKVIPMINLPKWLNLKVNGTLNKVIITEFNDVINGFLVNDVSRIYRISWENVIQPEEMTKGSDNSCITSVVKMDDKLILMLDFEKIIGDIFPESYFKPENIQLEAKGRDRKVLIAEDSPGIRKMVISAIQKGAYKTIEAENGSIALNILMDFYAQLKKSNKKINDFIDVIITDLEMPLIDGSHLIKKIRNLPEFDPIPIVVFSSMASDEMKLKIKKIGADDFVSKPQLPKLVEILETLINNRRGK